MSMSDPYPGYDDESVIAQKRLYHLLDDFVDELDRISSVFWQHLPGEFSMQPDLEKQFWILRSCAEEIGSDYSLFVENLISDYEYFRDMPDRARLEKIYKDVKSLQLLLTDSA